MTETQTIRFRIEEDTHVTIDEEVVPKVDNLHSVTQFCEQAISRYANDILRLSSGGSVLRDLVRRLNDIENMNETIPKCDPTARWGSGDLRKHVNVDLNPDTLSTLDDIDTSTGLGNSSVARICIFRSLYQISQSSESSFRYDFKEQNIEETWNDLETEFRKPRGEFHEIIYRRFTLMTERTMKMIQRDQNRFERFSEVYKKEFIESPAYEVMHEEYPERAFTDLENAIEELTSVTISKQQSGFLEEELKELSN